MDRLEAMHSFVAVARAGGFSAASRELGVPLATLSRRVADLERELGARLLRRSTREVALTDAGANFYATCRRLLDELRDAEEAVSGEYRSPRGELAVTAPLGFGRMHVQPAAHAFQSAYPDVSLRFALSDRVVGLVDEHVDVAVRIATLPDSDLVARAVGSVRRVICASPEYLQARGEPIHPEALERHEIVAWSASVARDTWRLRAVAGQRDSERNFVVRARLATTTAESAVDAAIAGLGLVRVACYQVAPAVRDGRLRIVLAEYESEPTPVSLVYPRDRLLPSKTRAFLDFVAPRLAAELAKISAAVG
jgi:DNA-binding transcriptional LysR family regulator